MTAPIEGPTAFYDLLSELLGLVNDRLAQTTGSPDRMGVVPGAEIAWDECECGLLAANVVRWFFSDSFPSDLQPGITAGAVTACEMPWVVGELLVEILRCAPQPEGEQLAPTTQALDETAQHVFLDAHHVREVVTCHLQELKNDERIVDYVITDQVSVGPEGMCVGSDLSFFVAFERT